MKTSIKILVKTDFFGYVPVCDAKFLLYDNNGGDILIDKTNIKDVSKQNENICISVDECLKQDLNLFTKYKGLKIKDNRIIVKDLILENEYFKCIYEVELSDGKKSLLAGNFYEIHNNSNGNYDLFTLDISEEDILDDYYKKIF